MIGRVEIEEELIGAAIAVNRDGIQIADGIEQVSNTSLPASPSLSVRRYFGK